MPFRLVPLSLAFSLLLVLGVVPARAQEELVFANVPFEETFVVTLPDNWAVWLQGEHETFEEADEAAVDMFSNIYRDAELTTPFINPEMKLLATPPEAPETGAIRLMVEMLVLSEFAQSVGMTADELTARVLAEALGGTSAGHEVLNGRPVAFSVATGGEQQLFSATTVFPDADRIAVVSLTGPDAFFEDSELLATFILSTLRLDGEPISGEAVVALTGEELPEGWTVPDEIVYAQAEAVTCVLNAELNVNMRRGPGVGYPVVGALAAGSSATGVAQANGTDGFVWFQTEEGTWTRIDAVVEDEACADLPVIEVD